MRAQNLPKNPLAISKLFHLVTYSQTNNAAHSGVLHQVNFQKVRLQFESITEFSEVLSQESKMEHQISLSVLDTGILIIEFDLPYVMVKI